MKRFELLAAMVALGAGSAVLEAHGPAHMHRESAALVNQALDTSFGGVTGHEGHAHSQTSGSGKSFREVVSQGEVRQWGATLSSGWQSRHVHYGVNETGNSGAYVNELGVWAGNFVFNIWSGFGLGNEFQEWDFSVAYNIDLGPVFVLPGYNLRYTPGIVEAGHGHHEDEEGGHEDEHGHHEEEHSKHGHSHKTFGNEVFLVVGTNAIPYVVPSAAFIWDLNNTPGAFLEFRLDGEVPVYKDVLVLEPYALLGINLGYNTRSYYGWNNFQFGVEAEWSVNEVIAVFGGVNYSIAMEALNDIGQGNVVWANAGLRFSF
jgi:hypothetical protein